MSPVYVKTRVGATGKRYLVYYRRGGRSYTEQYAGSFKTRREAQLRRDLVAGELAASRDPIALLEQLKRPPVPKPGLEARWNEFAASRVDVGEKAQRQYRNARDRWVPILGAARDPATITVDDIIDGVTQLSDLAANTVGVYVGSLAQVLDFCDIHPNPVRSKKVKLPQASRAEKAVPSNEAWQAILQHVKKRSRLALRLQECCALRVSEVCLLEWGDIDFIEGAIRIRRAGTKTAAGRRWVPVPEDLLDLIGELVHPDDRKADGRALGVKPTEVSYDLDQACIAAGVAEYGTHALRHRRISLWLRHGIDPVQVSRWSGHAKPSESLNTYGHTVTNPRGDEWRAFWLSRYAGSRAGERA